MLIADSSSKVLCKNCIYYIEIKNQAECELEYWNKIDKSKTRLYIPQLFECFEYRSRSSDK